MVPCLEAGGWGSAAQGMLLPHWHPPCPGLVLPQCCSQCHGLDPAQLRLPAQLEPTRRRHLQGELHYQHRAKLRGCVVVSFPLIIHVNERSCESWKLDQFSPIGCQQWHSRAAWFPWGGHLLLAPLPMVQVHNPELLLFPPLGEIAFARSTFPRLRVAWKVFQHGNLSTLHVQHRCQQQSCFSPRAPDAVCTELQWDCYPVPPNLPQKHELA